MTFRTPALRSLAIVAVAASLAGCSAATRLSEIGEAPKMTPTGNPTQQSGYRPVSMPMPTPQIAQPAANSMWRPGARAFFKDQRAAEVGDILTVQVKITDKANLSNSTDRSRTSTESAGLPAFFGYESALSKILPEAVSASSLLSADSTSTSSGSGQLQREESVEIQMAAVVTQILPNGLMAIAGRQEVRVNHELRELTVSGIIRPEDITSGNTITSEKIAEARISYGGRGTLSDVQQPRYGQQVMDVLMPW